MKPLATLFTLLTLPAFLYAQEETTVSRLSAFVEHIQVFNHLYPQEKVYLHFDNTGYFLGETIWFKAYVTTASDLMPTPLSRVLYVDLLDANGYVQNTQKLRIENGQADGAITLNRLGMKSGFYEVRAYTRPMLNWDTENLFSRVFPVFEEPESPGYYDKPTLRKLSRSYYNVPSKRAELSGGRSINVDFYPEGGALVNGLTSTVAFKVTDKKGSSVQANGYILTEKGDTLTHFSTLHEGMGSFLYTPKKEKSTLWIQPEGEKKSTGFPLPVSDREGAVMQVQSLHEEYVQIAVAATPRFTTVPLGLTVSCRGKVHFFDIVNLSALAPGNSGHALNIPKSQLAGGVNQVTLFTADGKILSERLVYVPGKEQAVLTVLSEKARYKSFEPVHMEIFAKDEKDQPLQTSVSLSVRDSGSEILTSYGEDIRSNILLSSDLKGFIVNPGYYFESEDSLRRHALDLLMLTQGYRRYDWSQMAGLVPFEASHPIEKGILLEGDVRTTLMKKKNKGINVKMIFYSDHGYQSARCETDKDGKFNYLADDFYGNWKLQLESLKRNKRKEQWITLNRLFAPGARPYNYYDTNLPSWAEGQPKLSIRANQTHVGWSEEDLRNDSLELAALSEKMKMLKEVVVQGRKGYQHIWNKGASFVYDVEEEADRLEDMAKAYNESLIDFLERINPYFHSRLVTVNKRNSAEALTLTAISAPGPSMVPPQKIEPSSPNSLPQTHTELKLTYKGRPVLLHNLQGVQYSSEIGHIAIIEDPVYIREYAPDLSNHKNVVIVDVTRRASTAKGREPVGVRLTTIQGFSLPRTFYNPDYSRQSVPEEMDVRRTLYWNPNVLTDPQGKATVSFYNNSTCRDMTVSAETLTTKGIPGSFYGELSLPDQGDTSRHKERMAPEIVQPEEAEPLDILPEDREPEKEERFPT